WLKITAPTVDPSALFPAAASLTLDRSDGPVEASFFVSPLAKQFSEILVGLLRLHFGGLKELDCEGIARGSLQAGRLIERGLPHYFDRLTPISLAVMKENQPEFADLISGDATLPANKEYVSPPYGGLKWKEGKQEIDFYVKKGEWEIRHWSVRLET